MTTFKIKYSGSFTPVIEPALADGSFGNGIVHSNIDKIIAGVNELSVSSTASDVAYKSYTTTTSSVSLNTITGLTLTGITFLYIAIAEAGSTGTPDVEVIIDGTNKEIKLTADQDWAVLRLSSGTGADIKLNSTASTTLAVVDILYGL